MQAAVSFLDSRLRSDQPSLQVRGGELETWGQCEKREKKGGEAGFGTIAAQSTADSLPAVGPWLLCVQASATAAPLPGGAGGGRISLSDSTLEVCLRVLAGNAGLLPSDTLQQFKMVQAAALQQHPQLASVVGDSSSLEAFAPDIGEPACIGLPVLSGSACLPPLQQQHQQEWHPSRQRRLCMLSVGFRMSSAAA
jgi:hypothetical protein